MIELSNLEKEKTHTITLNLEDGAGSVTFLVTLTATTTGETKTDLATFKMDPEEKQAIIKKYVSAISFLY